MFNARIKKKTLSVLVSVAVAAGLVVAPTVTAGAAAADVQLIGEVGTMIDSTPEANSPKYWENLYPGTDCYNHDFSEGNNAHGSLTDGGKTVTLNEFDDSWPGDHWALLVIKAGNTNNVVENPKAGVAYASPLTPNGKNQATVSHWIVCKGTTPPTTEPTVVTPKLLFSLPTCDVAGAITERTEDAIATWTQTPNADGSTTWTATPKDGYAFPARDGGWTFTVPKLDKLPLDSDQCRPVKPADKVTSIDEFTYDCQTLQVTVKTTTTTIGTEWNGEAWVELAPVDVETTSTREMTVAEKLECPVPQTTIEYREWVDGEWDCGDTTVQQTREIVETVYGRDEQGNPTAISSLRTEDRTRDLTKEEIGAECPLVPGDILSTCQGDVPYLGYAVTLPEGYTTDDETPVTITFVNPDGEDYVVTGQPLSGSLLWPGAKATEPKMWPGWDLVNGTYVQTEGNFAWTREGITVRFEVNPTFETEVEYPAATALCANPPKQAISPEPPTEVPGEEEPEQPAGEQPSDPSDPADPALAATGGGVSPILPIAGGAGLLLGLAALLTVAYQRRRVTS